MSENNTDCYEKENEPVQINKLSKEINNKFFYLIIGLLTLLYLFSIILLYLANINIKKDIQEIKKKFNESEFDFKLNESIYNLKESINIKLSNITKYNEKIYNIELNNKHINEMIEKLKNEITKTKDIKNSNDKINNTELNNIIKEIIENIKILNDKINNTELNIKEIIEDIKNLNNIINNTEFNIKEIKEENKNLNDKINNTELNIKEIKEDIKNLNEKINNIDLNIKEIKEENKNLNDIINIQSNNITDNKEIIDNLQSLMLRIKENPKNNLFQIHSDEIQYMNIFPESGLIITVSSDYSTKIYDLNFNLIYITPNTYNYKVFYVDIKDENNFVTSTKNILVKYIKKNNKWNWEKVIYDAHSDDIINVIFDSKGRLISASLDKTIKIWEKIDDEYIIIKILYHSDKVIALLLLEDQNILVSSGYDGTRFWDINNNYTEITYFKDAITKYKNTLKRIDDDRIIVRSISKNQTNSYYFFLIISISKKEIIKEVPIGSDNFTAFFSSIEKGIILVGGSNGNVLVFNSDNYTLIEQKLTIQNYNIMGFIELKNGLIASYDSGGYVYTWSF